MTDLHSSTGTYAVNALDRAELAEFDAHLATCAACQDEVAELSAAAAELSLLTLATPPPPLRSNILAAIRTTQQVPVLNGAVRSTSPVALDEAVRSTSPVALDEAVRSTSPVALNEAVRSTPSVAPGTAAPSTSPATTNRGRVAAEARQTVRSSRPRRAAPESEVPEPEDELEGRLDELALRRQRRRIRVLSGLVAATLALAVGLGGIIYILVQERQAQIAQTALEEQLYSAPDAVTSTTPLPGGGQATFIASKRLNRALFLGTDLPDPGRNRYQLWTATGTDLENLTGVFRDVQVADLDSGIKVFFSGNVAEADFLAVNLEPAGSTPAAPTNPVLAAGPTTV